MKLLSGRTALITGSRRGIGLAAARLFAAHGATVLLHGRPDSPGYEEQARALSEEFGTTVEPLPYDVSDPAAVEQAFGRIFSKYRKLDVLVNNAGIMRDAMLGMTPDELIQESFRVNAAAVLHHMQQASRIMRRSRQGSIINVSSIIGRFGYAGQTTYAASKAAVIGMTVAAAKELAAFRIRVNAVAPGFIETDMVAGVSEASRQQLLGKIGLGRFGTPEEVANLMLFLASDWSSYMTGQVIGVDGGMTV